MQQNPFGLDQAVIELGVMHFFSIGDFIAAYNMYQKAGNSKTMKNAQAQFPSVEEIFELGMEEGQAVKVVQ